MSPLNERKLTQVVVANLLILAVFARRRRADRGVGLFVPLR